LASSSGNGPEMDEHGSSDSGQPVAPPAVVWAYTDGVWKCVAHKKGRCKECRQVTKRSSPVMANACWRASWVAGRGTLVGSGQTGGQWALCTLLRGRATWSMERREYDLGVHFRARRVEVWVPFKELKTFRWTDAPVGLRSAPQIPEKGGYVGLAVAAKMFGLPATLFVTRRASKRRQACSLSGRQQGVPRAFRLGG
jgi:hypothetical protein